MAWLGWAQILRTRQVLLSSETSQDFTSIPIPNKPRISLTTAATIAQKQFPHAEVRWLSTPENATGVYEIQLRQPGEANTTYPATYVWVDQYSGNVLSTRNPNQFSLRETYLNIQYPLHNGEILGLAGRILIFCLGFVPLIVYVTGMTMWWKRLKR